MPQRKLGRGVALVGAGMSKFGAFKGKASRDLFVEAYQEMLGSVDKGIDPGSIEALYIGNFSSDLFEAQGQNAPILAEWAGLLPRPATRIEGACASGGLALRQGILAVASGIADIVLVGGVEKMTDLPPKRSPIPWRPPPMRSTKFRPGLPSPVFMPPWQPPTSTSTGATSETLMKVAYKNHENGALNPKAQFGQRIADVMAARKASAIKKGRPVPAWADEMEFLHDDAANPWVAWPLRLFDCSPISDGAATVLLVSEDLARSFTDQPLYVVGTGHASDGALHGRRQPHQPARGAPRRPAGLRDGRRHPRRY